jgi:4-carboxymuconolactone decarboxylase
MRMATLSSPYDPAAAARLADWGVGPDDEALQMVRVLVAQHPDLGDALRPLGFFFAGDRTALDTRTRELVVTRVTARCGCEYEWGLRVAIMAEAADLTHEQIAATLEPTIDPVAWTDLRDRAVLAAVDQLHDTGRLDDPGYSALRESYDDRQIVELLILAGWYHAVSYLDAGARLPAEPGTARFAQHRIEGGTP